VLDHTEWATDPHFATNPARVQHREVLVPLLQEVFSHQDVVFWLHKIAAVDVPCGPVQTLDQVFADEQVVARDMIWRVPHPTAGEIRLVGSPLKLSETPAACRSHPPLLGEHTEEVLTSLLGYSTDEVRRLRAEKAI
jgi:formyl-CoA transferase